MNQLFSGVTPESISADRLIAETKTTLATEEVSPAFTAIEEEVVCALSALAGWERNKAEGIAVAGGSAANFLALQCARQRLLPEYKSVGMQGRRLQVFVSKDAHYSFRKAAVAMGLGQDNIIEIEVDKKRRMDPAALASAISNAEESGATPLMVAATAGTTVYGSFDPIDAIAEVCKKKSLWLHVDAAWGGPILFSNAHKHYMQGIERADSYTFDGHKLLGASLNAALFLTKHQGILLAANDVSGADYLFHNQDQTVDRGRMSWQCMRRADVLSLYFIWKRMGAEGLGQFVDGLLNLQKEFVKWIRTEKRLMLVQDPEFLNICVRVLPRNEASAPLDWAKNIREQLIRKNLAMVNYSSDENGTFLRLIIANPKLTLPHLTEIMTWALEE